ncbi:hypothetical protein QOT17_009554 [Balamuthia mandrillaris]
MSTLRKRNWRQIRYPAPLWGWDDEDAIDPMYGSIIVEETSTPRKLASPGILREEEATKDFKVVRRMSTPTPIKVQPLDHEEEPHVIAKEEAVAVNDSSDAPTLTTPTDAEKTLIKFAAMHNVDTPNPQKVNKRSQEENEQKAIEKEKEKEKEKEDDSDRDDDTSASDNSESEASQESEKEDEKQKGIDKEDQEEKYSELTRLEEIDALFEGREDRTLTFVEFYAALKERTKVLAELDVSSSNQHELIVKLLMGAHTSQRVSYAKYQIVSAFFGSLCNDKNMLTLLNFYRDMIAGNSNYTVDRAIGWFMGALLPEEEENLLSSVPPQTFIVSFGVEDSTFVFSYNDYDEDGQEKTSTFLISITYNPQTGLFSGMDMENPDSDQDVHYKSLAEIATMFKKLGFRPLSPHILFGYGEKVALV